MLIMIGQTLGSLGKHIYDMKGAFTLSKLRGRACQLLMLLPLFLFFFFLSINGC